MAGAQNGIGVHVLWSRWSRIGVLRVRPIRLFGVWATTAEASVAAARAVWIVKLRMAGVVGWSVVDRADARRPSARTLPAKPHAPSPDSQKLLME
jgi:hypothetical protein